MHRIQGKPMRLPSTLTNERGMAHASTLQALLLILGLMVGALAFLIWTYRTRRWPFDAVS